MALFFDQLWYDARLAERGLTRAVLAAVAGMTGEELALAYKDQRELTAAQIAAFAELLGVPLAEAARRAGVGAHAAASAGRDGRWSRRWRRWRRGSPRSRRNSPA
jgi:transcriptional regulator with XRE-family HTH domain